MFAEVEGITATRAWVYVGAFVLAVYLLLWMPVMYLLERDLPGLVARKHVALEALRPGDKVLLCPATHPITAEDASYYASPVKGVEDRLAETVRRLQPRWRLPDCDYRRALERDRPFLIDGFMTGTVPERDGQVMIDLIVEQYQAILPGHEEEGLAWAVFRRKKP
jgi:hypothetical protein